MRLLSTTATNAYKLDVDRLAREVGVQCDAMYTQTNRLPCAVYLNYQTRHEVMAHQPGPGMQPYWAPSVDGVKPATFVGVALLADDSVPLGYATLAICDNCMGVPAPGNCVYSGG